MVAPVPTPPPSPPTFSSRQLAYQQAAGWVQMVNTLTWTLASFYLLSSAVMLGTAINEKDSVILHILFPIIWLALLGIWVAIDCVYLASARHARHTLERIEAEFPTSDRFFRSQKANGFGKNTINNLLYGTAGVFAIAWIAVLWIGIVRLYSKDEIPKPACCACCPAMKEESSQRLSRALSSVMPAGLAPVPVPVALKECVQSVDSLPAVRPDILCPTPELQSLKPETIYTHTAPSTLTHRGHRRRCDRDRSRSRSHR